MQSDVLIIAPLSLAGLGLGLGFLLGYAAKFLKVEQNPVVDKVIALLPGSNCGQCGYPGCAPAAEAIAKLEAAPTCCPPGGRPVAEDIAVLLNISLEASSGNDNKPLMYAQVDEAACVGCAKCLKHCPTDAIVGAVKQIHVVIQDACTGCEACITACPTNCLTMYAVKPTLKTWYWEKPKLSALPVLN